MHIAPLRFAILHHDGQLAAWQLRCVEELIALEDVRPQFLLTRQSCSDVPRALEGAARILLPAALVPDVTPPAARVAVARIKKLPTRFCAQFPRRALSQGASGDTALWRVAI